MITVSEYQKSYFDLLVAMHEDHKSPVSQYLTPETLPEIGYVAYNNAVIVCIGFLRRVEGGYGQIDTLVTNPNLGANTRHIGLVALVDKLLGKAKELKLKGIVSYTSDEGIIKRAESLGFKNTNQIVISLDLKS